MIRRPFARPPTFQTISAALNRMPGRRWLSKLHDARTRRTRRTDTHRPIRQPTVCQISSVSVTSYRKFIRSPYHRLYQALRHIAAGARFGVPCRVTHSETENALPTRLLHQAAQVVGKPWRSRARRLSIDPLVYLVQWLHGNSLRGRP